MSNYLSLPCVLVIESPRQECSADILVVVIAGSEHIFIHLGLGRKIFFCVHAWVFASWTEFNIDLRDVHLESHVTEGAYDFSERFSGDPITNSDVCLNANTIDWHSLI